MNTPPPQPRNHRVARPRNPARKPGTPKTATNAKSSDTPQTPAPVTPVTPVAGAKPMTEATSVGATQATPSMRQPPQAAQQTPSQHQTVPQAKQHAQRSAPRPTPSAPPPNAAPSAVPNAKPNTSATQGSHGKPEGKPEPKLSREAMRAADRAAFLAPESPVRPRGAENLTLLGQKKTTYVDKYTPALLERFENQHRTRDFWVKLNCPEFTSLCPITGQPDFATFYISYIPDEHMVESKSLKLYLFSFRNHGAFHEDCANTIMTDLIRLLSPRYIEVWGKFMPRGGISIDPYCNYGRPSTRFEEFAQQRLIMHDLSLEKVDNR